MRTAWAIAGVGGVIAATAGALLLVDNNTPTRTVPAFATRGIDSTSADAVAKDMARLAHALPPAPSDGLRFVALPAFSDRLYAVQVGLPIPGGPAKGIVLIAPRDGGLKRRYRFNIPGPEARRLFATVDAALPGLGRDTGMDVDGTPAALERITGDGSRTWTTNLADPAWAGISRDLLSLLRRHANAPGLPDEDDWHRTR